MKCNGTESISQTSLNCWWDRWGCDLASSLLLNVAGEQAWLSTMDSTIRLESVACTYQTFWQQESKLNRLLFLFSFVFAPVFFFCSYLFLQFLACVFHMTSEMHKYIKLTFQTLESSKGGEFPFLSRERLQHALTPVNISFALLYFRWKEETFFPTSGKVCCRT